MTANASTERIRALSNQRRKRVESGTAGDGSAFERAASSYQQVLREVERRIVWREDLFEAIFIAQLCEGHVLIEGHVGSGKTESVKVLGEVEGMKTERIQLTPDMMPQDITGSDMPGMDEQWHFVSSRLTSHLVLIDEVNRASPKTLAGLIEATGERQITAPFTGTHKLESPFTVAMTMNPIEHEGTYELLEALLDRALLKLVTQPLRGKGQLIDVLDRVDVSVDLEQVLGGPERMLEMISLRKQVRVAPEIKQLIENLVLSFDWAQDSMEYGPTERAAISLMKVAQAAALISGRGAVTVSDLGRHAVNVLQHRMELLPEAEINGQNPVALVQSKLDLLGIPRGN